MSKGINLEGVSSNADVKRKLSAESIYKTRVCRVIYYTIYEDSWGMEQVMSP